MSQPKGWTPGHRSGYSLAPMEIRTTTIERLRDALLASGARRSTVQSSAYRTLAREGLLSAEENAALARVAAPAETMFLVMAADEQVTDTELAALRGAIRGLTGDVLSDELVVFMMEKFARQLHDDGLEKRLATIAEELDDIEAQNAFALAAAVALADNQFSSEEGTVISKVQRALGLSDADVQNVLGQLASDNS